MEVAIEWFPPPKLSWSATRSVKKTLMSHLWYESAPECRVATLSSLDDVDLGTPRDLLHKHRKLGVLKWSDLYGMCSSRPLRGKR